MWAEPLILLLHLSATAVMVGIIWFVQLIHYPWFHAVPHDRFIEYHKHYTQTIGFIVGPVMLVELITGILVIMVVPDTDWVASWSNLMLLAVIWLSTLLFQIPCHHRLGRGYDAATHRTLVATNWIRTFAWSIRLLLLLFMNARLIHASLH